MRQSKAGFCCLVLCAFVVGCFAPRPAPRPDDGGGVTPQPTSSFSARAAFVGEDYLKRLADAHERGADLLESSRDVPSDELLEFMLSETSEAKKEAFAPLFKLANDRFGEDRYDQAVAAKAYREMAAGFRKAAGVK